MFLLANKALRASGIGHALIGGLASNIWVSSSEVKFTDDVDFAIVSLWDDPVGEMVSWMNRHRVRGIRPFGIEQILAEENKVAYFRKLSVKEVEVDFVIPKNLRFSRSVIRRARTVGPQTQRARVATPEDVLLLKAMAQRLKDIPTISALSRRPGLNWRYIEGWARELGVWSFVKKFAPIAR